MKNTINATYVSVWDESTPIRTSCKFNVETNMVSDIESVDVEELDLDFLSEEYVEIPDGTVIKSFYNLDIGGYVANGQSYEM
jgi:hypothetical protein